MTDGLVIEDIKKMGLFIIGGNSLPDAKCLDLAEELVEKGLVNSDVNATQSRLKSWRDEFIRCARRGSIIFGYLLEQYEERQRKLNSAERTGAYYAPTIGGFKMGTSNVLDTLIELSKSIHPDDVPECDGWLSDNLPVIFKCTSLFDTMSETERKEIIGISKSAIRHLQKYKDPIYFKSEELPSMYFIQERNKQK